jgi:glycosyltransferase involved in cell wall biosynthesis
MRILWLSPHFRALARIRAEEFRALGADVMLVTADIRYSEFDHAREYETVLIGRPIPWADWLPCYRTYQEAKRFRPDVVVTEILGDPRWRMFASLAPRIRLVHDDKPHDEQNVRPWWNRMFFDRWDVKADATIAFSAYVASNLPSQGRAGSRLYVAPLHSDLDPYLVPDFIPAGERRNFVMFGRQNPYKNHAVVFAAWEAHVAGSAWRGDELVLFGDGQISRPLPPRARWVRGDFKYREVVGELSRAKGSIVHHTKGASQSGVQVLSMQLGVPTLVSTGGALPEYQPTGLSVTGVNDIEGLSRAFDGLADPAEVDRQSRIALDHYKNYYDSSLFARRFLEIAKDITEGS